MSRAVAFLGLGVLVVFWFFLVTHQTGRLFDPEPYGQFYDHQALAFAEGRWDVPREAVENEAFVRNGKAYGYWGPFPALLRAPLVLFPEAWWVGRTSRVSCLLAALLIAVSALVLWRAVARQTGCAGWKRSVGDWGTILLVGGSPVTFLVARPYVYHEVVLWGVAGALGAVLAIWRAAETHSARWLLLAAAAGSMAALSRPTTGYGALLAVLGAAGWRYLRVNRADRRPVAWALLVALVGIALPLLYNWVRLGSANPPYSLHVLYDEARLARTDGGHLFQPANAWATLLIYLNPLHGYWNGREFPWYFAEIYYPQLGRRPVLDHWEPHGGLGGTMTAALVLGCLGSIAWSRAGWFRLCTLGGTTATVLATCMFACITERYLGDFVPLLLLVSLMGLATILTRVTRRRVLVHGLVFGGLLVSVWQFTALGLSYQHSPLSGMSSNDETAWRELTQRIDRPLHAWANRLQGLPLPVIKVASWRDLPDRPSPGTIARDINGTGTLWFDGSRWVVIAGECPEILTAQISVTPPPGAVFSGPLVVTGETGLANIVFLRSVGNGRYVVGIDVWGIALRLGPEFEPSGSSMNLHVRLDRINGEVRVHCEGRDVFATRVRLHAFSPVFLGENPAGGSHAGPSLPGICQGVVSFKSES